MSESDYVIVNWPTALQGDSRLAAAPFAPRALLVADSDLGEILSTVKQTALVYGFSRFNLPKQGLMLYVPNTLQYSHYKACSWPHIIFCQLIFGWFCNELYWLAYWSTGCCLQSWHGVPRSWHIHASRPVDEISATSSSGTCSLWLESPQSLVDQI